MIQRGKARWLFPVLVLSLTLAMVLAGCNKQGDKADAAPTGSSSPAASSAAPTQSAESSIPTDKTFEIKFMSWHKPEEKYGQAYNFAFEEYMKLHPNVKIEHLYQPNAEGGYEKLLDTQFVSHNAPDATMMYAGWIQKYTDQDYLMLLDGYMQEPTPYNENKTWVDTFINGESAFAELKSKNKYGAIAFVPVDGGPGQASAYPFFYNKAIFDKAGITQLPTTWKEFIEVCKKIKEAGYDPIAADNGRGLYWFISWTGAQLGENYLPSMFDKKYERKELRDDMAAVALLTDKLKKDDPVLNAHFDLLKDFSQYWQKGWQGVNIEQASQLFMFGKAAMLLDGNWMYGHYEENIKDFEFGLLPFPLITKETTEYAAEGYPVTTDQMGYGWGLNKDLEKDADKAKVVVDIFKFITSKDIQAKMSDIGVWAPVTADVTAPEKMKPFLSNDKHTVVHYLDNPIIWNSKDGFTLSQVWLTGESTKEEFLNKVEKDYKATVTQKVKDQLDPAIGLPLQIENLQKTLDEQKTSGKPEAVVKATEQSLEIAKLKLEFYKQYGEPALK